MCAYLTVNEIAIHKIVFQEIYKECLLGMKSHLYNTEY